MHFCEKKNLFQRISKVIESYDNLDPQGILWCLDLPYSREELRTQRMITYNSFKNKAEKLEHKDQTVNFNCKFFSYLTSHPILVEFKHFQLRNNIHCVSSEEIYTKVKANEICKYNPITKSEEIISKPSFDAVSFSIYENNLLVGGMEGELMLQDLNKNIKFSKVITEATSRITNCVSMFDDESGLNLLVCSNDKKVRIMDPETQAEKQVIDFGDCVNFGKIAPDKKQIAVCLDCCEDFIIDKNTGEKLHELKGHTDFGFCADWDPSNEYLLATGNQDRSVMIWDIRQGYELTPVHIIHAQLGSVLNLRYSSNGKYLVFSESADFLNVIDKRAYNERQSFDYFGEISGFGLCEDNPELRIFLGLADSNFNCMVELRENSQKLIEI